MRNFMYLLVIYLFFCSCNEIKKEDKTYEKEKSNHIVTDKYILQVLHVNLNWSPFILAQSGEQLNGSERNFLIETFLSNNLKEAEEKIRELSIAFEDSSNFSFLIEQLHKKTDSIIDNKVFEGFPDRSTYKIISLKKKEKFIKSENIVSQVSFPITTKTGGLVFVVNRCWAKGVKKEWLNGFVWNKEKSKYEIYLSIGLGSENDFAYEFSKNGDFR
ncbi:MAG: hypothetical protein ACJ04Q_03325 [Flavobacteriales bacterium]